MTDTAWFSVDDHQPTVPGLYPTLVCWDPREGYFPQGSYWEGTKWEFDAGPVVMFIPTRCANLAEADIVAYRHDPEW